MNEKIYSRKWALQVYKEFMLTHGDNAAKLMKSYGFSAKTVVTWIQKNQKAWNVFKFIAKNPTNTENNIKRLLQLQDELSQMYLKFDE